MNESEVQEEIQKGAVYYGTQFMRNNSGAFQDATGRSIRFGLGNISKKHSENIKSSDLIGFTCVLITPEMVGKTIAVFTAGEIKKEGWKRNLKDTRENAQAAFINWIRSKGGIANFLTSITDFHRTIHDWKNNIV
jgi:L-rhamnose isomerase